MDTYARRTIRFIMLEIAWVVVGLGFAAQGVLSIHRWWNSPQNKAQRSLRTEFRTTIRDAKDGTRVKIVGRARSAGVELAAPLSQRSCFAWQVVVEADGVEERREVLVRDSARRDLLVEDETGRALVKIASARLALEEDRAESASTVESLPPTVARFCADRGCDASAWLVQNRWLLYFESVIAEGDRIAVMGVAHWEAVHPDGREGGYRAELRRLVIDASGEDVVLIRDVPDTTVVR